MISHMRIVFISFQFIPISLVPASLPLKFMTSSSNIVIHNSNPRSHATVDWWNLSRHNPHMKNYTQTVNSYPEKENESTTAISPLRGHTVYNRQTYTNTCENNTR